MTQYIDKAAVIAEINRVLNSYDPNQITSGRYALVDLRDFLNTLEVKEVDYRPIDKDFERDAVSFCIDNGLNTTPYIAKTIAKHFFELGIKAQKGDEEWQKSM